MFFPSGTRFSIKIVMIRYPLIKYQLVRNKLLNNFLPEYTILHNIFAFAQIPTEAVTN